MRERERMATGDPKKCERESGNKRPKRESGDRGPKI